MSDSEQQDPLQDLDRLVTLVTAPSEFAANAIVIVLQDAGIDACAFGNIQGGLGYPLGSGYRGWGTPVQIRQEDLERAQAALDRAKQDSVDINWDEVELGNREDNLPLSGGSASPVFMVCFAAAVLIVVVVVVAAIVSFVD